MHTGVHPCVGQLVDAQGDVLLLARVQLEGCGDEICHHHGFLPARSHTLETELPEDFLQDGLWQLVLVADDLQGDFVVVAGYLQTCPGSQWPCHQLCLWYVVLQQ